MAITVSGTTITFNDATTQTTAAGAAPTAGNGITVTSGVIALGNPTDSSVGTYTIAYPTQGNGQSTDYTIGTTIAGSSLRSAGPGYAGSYTSITPQFSLPNVSAGLSGTWKSCARVRNFLNYCCNTEINATLWIRTA